MGTLSKKLPFSYHTLAQIVNLWRVPTEDQMISLACVFLKPIDYLFPEVLLDSLRRKVFSNRTKLLDEEQVKRLPSPAPRLLTDGGMEEVEAKVDQGLLKRELYRAMAGCTEREKKVISLRFGLDNGISRSLEEVAKEFNVTRERIRQIEDKALKYLRHPSHHGKLKPFLDLIDEESKKCKWCNKPIEEEVLEKHPKAKVCLRCYGLSMEEKHKIKGDWKPMKARQPESIIEEKPICFYNRDELYRDPVNFTDNSERYAGRIQR